MTTDITTVATPQQYALKVLTAERALDEATALSEVVRFRDQAEAIKQFADTARYGLKLQNLAAGLKLKAERKAGELLGDLERSKGGNPDLTPDTVSGVSEYRRTIDELHINERAARRWQEVARIPETAFRQFIDGWDSSEEPVELTTRGLLRMAKASAPPRSPKGGDKEVEPPVGVSKTAAATAKRRDDIKRLTEVGHKRNDIAQRLGISTSAVIRIQQELGVQSVETRIGRARSIDVNRVVDGIVTGVVVPRTSLELLEGQMDQLDGERLPAWIASLSESITMLSRLRTELRRVLDERS